MMDILNFSLHQMNIFFFSETKTIWKYNGGTLIRIKTEQNNKKKDQMLLAEWRKICGWIAK